GLYSTLFLDLPFCLAATASVCFFYVATQRELGLTGWQRVKYLPFIMSLGIGLAVNNAKAVIEALLNEQSGFARTPNTPTHGKTIRSAVERSSRGSRSRIPLLELAFGLYFSGALWFAIDAGIWPSVPFLVLFQVGFLYGGVMSLFQGRSIARRALAPAVAPAA